MTGPEHYRRAEELAAEAHRLPGQGDGQATAACGPPLPRPMRCWLWPRPRRSVHPVRITAWADAAGTGSDPAAVIIDAERPVRA
jgi:hypothetical protein